MHKLRWHQPPPEAWMNVQATCNEVIALQHAVLHYYRSLDYIRQADGKLSEVQVEVERLLQSWQWRLEMYTCSRAQEI